MKSFKTIVFPFAVFLFALGCLNTKRILNCGKLVQTDFTEKITFDDPLNLVIIPVSINGTIYRFLFDTGAPNVISVELQQKYQFKSIAKKPIRDSEGKTQKVKYIRLDSVLIGNINFLNTAAFVTDLKANPVLDCLDLDGIIGSNLMRFCVWQVDYSSRTLTLTDLPEQLSYSSDYQEISFHSDNQHSIKIDFKTPNAKITNLKIDYGSTGSIGVPNKVYKVLKERGDLSEQQTEVGFTQSGIFGDFLVDTTESSVVQFGKFGDFKIGKTEIENDGKGLLGTSILKNYIVTMNWQKRTIGFDEIDTEIEFERNTFGFSPTFHNEKTIVKSVIVDGSAFIAGLQPGMNIQSIDEFSVENLAGFCEYVLRDKNQRDTLFVKAFKDDLLETFKVVVNEK